MIGKDASTAGGQGNVIIGVNSKTSGNDNIIIGNDIDLLGVINTIRIGDAGIQFASVQVPF